jgi:hypothetical protein
MSSAEKSLEKRQNKTAQEAHPVQASGMSRRHGELVRHDVLTCKLCQNAAGCPGYSDDDDDVEETDVRSIAAKGVSNSSSSGTSSYDASADEHSVVVEDSSIEESVEVTAPLPAFREA